MMPEDRSKSRVRYRPPREPKLLRKQLAEKTRKPPGKGRDPGRAGAEGLDNQQDCSLRPLDLHPGESDALRSGIHIRDVAHRGTGLLDILSLDEFPRPPSGGLDGTLLPRGPDLARKQQIVEAIESKRERRRQKAGPAKSQDVSPNIKTQANLLQRGKLLLERYKWEEKVELDDTDLDPRSFVDWLTVMQLFWTRSSWRLYQPAALAVIERLPNTGRDEAIAALIGSGRIEANARRQYKQSRAKNPKLSEDRAELIRADDYRELLARLRKMSGARSVIEPLEDWLVAGLHTGVLPAEWPLADLEKGLDGHGRRRVWLHVANSTATGVQRTLDISGYTDPTLKAIERMVKRSEQWVREGTTARHQSEVARALDDACGEVFPSRSIRFSLFTVRHQFIANMKAVLQDDAVVSALVGRLMVKTERAHHTKLRAAWSVDDVREIPTPPKRQVDRFRNLLRMYQERLTYREAKAVRRGLDADCARR